MRGSRSEVLGLMRPLMQPFLVLTRGHDEKPDLVAYVTARPISWASLDGDNWFSAPRPLGREGERSQASPSSVQRLPLPRMPREKRGRGSGGGGTEGGGGGGWSGTGTGGVRCVFLLVASMFSLARSLPPYTH